VKEKQIMSIDITNCDLRKVISAVYELSAPQGLGFLNFTPKPLSDEQIDAILASGSERYPLDMDYVGGRSCKFHVRREANGRLTIPDRWYDHTGEQLRELCKVIGAEVPAAV
jgi:hypothetical protein